MKHDKLREQSPLPESAEKSFTDESKTEEIKQVRKLNSMILALMFSIESVMSYDFSIMLCLQRVNLPNVYNFMA